MDYEGQRLAELLFQWIICSFGAVGWVIGYINQNFYHTFFVWLVGVIISVIVSHLRIPSSQLCVFISSRMLTFNRSSLPALDLRSRLALLQPTPSQVA
jgi:hypothetical protein